MLQILTQGLSDLALQIDSSGPDKPMNAALHLKLLENLRIFFAIGGLPAVVSAYCAGEGFLTCQRIPDELLTVFRDDFAKYRKKASPARLRETFDSIALQTGGKFGYSKVTPESTLYETKNSFELLERAGLVYKVTHTAARGLPLGAQVNPRKFKALLFDMGVHQRVMGLDIK